MSGSGDSEVLLERAKSGEPEAFRELLSQHSTAVYGYLRRWLRDGASADDVFQETAIEFMRSLARIDQATAVRPLLFRIATSRGRNHLRHETRLRRREEGSQGGDEAQADASERADAKSVLEAALAKLPEETRQLLLLRFGEQLSSEEIASVLGIPSLLVRMRVSRARAKFLAAVEALEVEP